MSTIDCGACNDLRNNAPNFVQNGVDDIVAASLKNNTGLNPSLTVLHDDCEDLNDVNDCLIGRMRDELEAYDVCDWKDYMKKFVSNLYETLKGIIAAICGLWTRVEGLCIAVNTLSAFARKRIPNATKVAGAWTSTGFSQLAPSNPTVHTKDKWRIGLRIGKSTYADCDNGTACQGAFMVEIWYDDDPSPYVTAAYSMNGFSIGDVWGTVSKSQLVPTYFTESQWKGILAVQSPLIFGTTSNFMSIVTLRGYTVINGIEYNEDLRSFGEDVGVIQVRGLIGAAGTVSGIGYTSVDAIKIYDC